MSFWDWREFPCQFFLFDLKLGINKNRLHAQKLKLSLFFVFTCFSFVITSTLKVTNRWLHLLILELKMELKWKLFSFLINLLPSNFSRNFHGSRKKNPAEFATENNECFPLVDNSLSHYGFWIFTCEINANQTDLIIS